MRPLSVSTDEQAKRQTSLDSQIGEIRRWCEGQSIDLVEIYIEPGLSATDENRPQFKRLMAEATQLPRRYDVVVVYSLSRFARDLALQLVSYRTLDRAGVQLLSVSKPFARSAAGNLVRNIVGAA